LKATTNGPAGDEFDIEPLEIPTRAAGGASFRGQPVRSSGKLMTSAKAAIRLPAHGEQVFRRQFVKILELIIWLQFLRLGMLTKD